MNVTSKRRPSRALPVFGCLFGGALLLVVSGGSSPAQARLSDAACSGLATQYFELSTAGVRDWMAPGPDAARERLTTEQLDSVRRWLDLLGDVKFRCPSLQMVLEGPGAPENLPVRNPQGERRTVALRQTVVADAGGDSIAPDPTTSTNEGPFPLPNRNPRR